MSIADLADQGAEKSSVEPVPAAAATTKTPAAPGAEARPDAPAKVQAQARSEPIRVDLRLIADMVSAGSRVLDVGCGDGTLLRHMWQAKQVDGRGIEISQAGVNA